MSLDSPTQDWQVSGITESVDLDHLTITFSLEGFHELHMTLIHPRMPFWLLKPETNFNTTIPRRCIHEQSLLTVEWGEFTPVPYQWADDDELMDMLEVFFEDGQEVQHE